ncbi:MAG: hypothetical protein QXV17_10785 [Candidatus Micrarchaeaceae archaeon]
MTFPNWFTSFFNTASKDIQGFVHTAESDIVKNPIVDTATNDIIRGIERIPKDIKYIRRDIITNPIVKTVSHDITSTFSTFENDLIKNPIVNTAKKDIEGGISTIEKDIKGISSTLERDIITNPVIDTVTKDITSIPQDINNIYNTLTNDWERVTSEPQGHAHAQPIYKIPKPTPQLIKTPPSPPKSYYIPPSIPKIQKLPPISNPIVDTSTGEILSLTPQKVTYQSSLGDYFGDSIIAIILGALLI